MAVIATVSSAVPVRGKGLPTTTSYQLPDTMAFPDITAVSGRILSEHCVTSSCLGYLRVVAAFLINDHGRGSAGTVYFGHVPDAQERDISVGRDLKVLLRDNRRLWPWMCKALVAIQARDDMGHDSHSPIASMSLDTARRITTPRLDCLGQVSRLIPNSNYREGSLFYARRYCVSERARDCWRLAR